jgi:CPA2 family monovalent cation:H+ antiporter-2
VIVDRAHALVTEAREHGSIAVHGDACSSAILGAADVAHARLIVIATRDGLQARRILELARAINPLIKTAMRAEGEAELAQLQRMRVDLAVTSEQQLGLVLGNFAVSCLSAPAATGGTDKPFRPAQCPP